MGCFSCRRMGPGEVESMVRSLLRFKRKKLKKKRICPAQRARMILKSTSIIEQHQNLRASLLPSPSCPNGQPFKVMVSAFDFDNSSLLLFSSSTSQLHQRYLPAPRRNLPSSLQTHTVKQAGRSAANALAELKCIVENTHRRLWL